MCDSNMAAVRKLPLFFGLMTIDKKSSVLGRAVGRDGGAVRLPWAAKWVV